MDSILLHEFLLKSKLSVKQVGRFLRGRKMPKQQKNTLGERTRHNNLVEDFFLEFLLNSFEYFFNSKEENKWRASSMQISVIF